MQAAACPAARRAVLTSTPRPAESMNVTRFRSTISVPHCPRARTGAPVAGSRRKCRSPGDRRDHDAALAADVMLRAPSMTSLLSPAPNCPGRWPGQSRSPPASGPGPAAHPACLHLGHASLRGPRPRAADPCTTGLPPLPVCPGGEIARVQHGRVPSSRRQNNVHAGGRPEVDDRRLVSGIEPTDDLGREHRRNALSWLAGTDDIFRGTSAHPSPHLVSYFLLVNRPPGACCSAITGCPACGCRLEGMSSPASIRSAPSGARPSKNSASRRSSTRCSGTGRSSSR